MAAASLEERIATTERTIASAHLELARLRDDQAELRRGTARIETLPASVDRTAILAALASPQTRCLCFLGSFLF